MHLLNHEIGRQLIGRNAEDITAIWETLYNGVRAIQSARAGHAMPQIARRRLTVAAISAVDIALWEILGKHLNQPVWQQLGGRKADRLPPCASGGWANAAEIGAQLQSYIAQGGFRAVKMRVGSMDAAAHISAARVKAARAVLGTGDRDRRRCAWHLYSGCCCVGRMIHLPAPIYDHRQIAAVPDGIHRRKEDESIAAQQILRVVLQASDQHIKASGLHQPVDPIQVKNSPESIASTFMS